MIHRKLIFINCLIGKFLHLFYELVERYILLDNLIFLWILHDRPDWYAGMCCKPYLKHLEITHAWIQIVFSPPNNNNNHILSSYTHNKYF